MTEPQIKKQIDGTKNLCIIGPAGVGKSYLLNQIIESHDNVMVCAPTAMAAIKIGGETAHKVFHIPIPAYESPSFAKGKKGAITQAQLKIIAQADIIIIDEISQFKNSDFAFMIKVIRKAEKLKGSKIRIIVSGDFSQLPPVVKRDEVKLLKKFGFDPSGFAFTTSEWKSCNFKVVELTEIKRQKDKEFIEQLNKVRDGDASSLEYFNQFVGEPKDTESAIYICGTNADADNINREYLESLTTPVAAFQAEKTGRCMTSVVDDTIVVKIGAQVIFIANDYIHGLYKNGTFGIIKAFNQNSVTVEIDGKDVEIYKRDFYLYSYTSTGGHLDKKQIGCISQYPFKLGKAITIHKSQGQTFTNVILSPKIFAAGQLYVALSRVTGPDGLTILDEIKPEYLITNEIVAKFYESGYKWDVKKPSRKKASATKTSSAKKASKTGTTKAKKKAAKKTVVKKASSNSGKTSSKKKKDTVAKTATKTTVSKTSVKKPVARKTSTKVSAKKASTKKAVSRKKSAKKSK